MAQPTSSRRPPARLTLLLGTATVLFQGILVSAAAPDSTVLGNVAVTNAQEQQQQHGVGEQVYNLAGKRSRQPTAVTADISKDNNNTNGGKNNKKGKKNAKKDVDEDRGADVVEEEESSNTREKTKTPQSQQQQQVDDYLSGLWKDVVKLGEDPKVKASISALKQTIHASNNRQQFRNERRSLVQQSSEEEGESSLAANKDREFGADSAERGQPHHRAGSLEFRKGHWSHYKNPAINKDQNTRADSNADTNADSSIVVDKYLDPKETMFGAGQDRGDKGPRGENDQRASSGLAAARVPSAPGRVVGSSPPLHKRHKAGEAEDVDGEEGNKHQARNGKEKKEAKKVKLANAEDPVNLAKADKVWNAKAAPFDADYGLDYNEVGELGYNQPKKNKADKKKNKALKNQGEVVYDDDDDDDEDVFQEQQPDKRMKGVLQSDQRNNLAATRSDVDENDINNYNNYNNNYNNNNNNNNDDNNIEVDLEPGELPQPVVVPDRPGKNDNIKYPQELPGNVVDDLSGKNNNLNNGADNLSDNLSNNNNDNLNNNNDSLNNNNNDNNIGNNIGNNNGNSNGNNNGNHNGSNDGSNNGNHNGNNSPNNSAKNNDNFSGNNNSNNNNNNNNSNNNNNNNINNNVNNINNNHEVLPGTQDPPKHVDVPGKPKKNHKNGHPQQKSGTAVDEKNIQHGGKHVNRKIDAAPAPTPSGGAPGGAPGGTPGGAPGGTPGGAPGGAPGGTPSGTPGGAPGGATSDPALPPQGHSPAHGQTHQPNSAEPARGTRETPGGSPAAGLGASDTPGPGKNASSPAGGFGTVPMFGPAQLELTSGVGALIPAYSTSRVAAAVAVAVIAAMMNL